jgi:hypothetical protein
MCHLNQEERFQVSSLTRNSSIHIIDLNFFLLGRVVEDMLDFLNFLLFSTCFHQFFIMVLSSSQ